MSGRAWRIGALWCLTMSGAAGCTLHHSRDALWDPGAGRPSPEATFVSEEDSGVSALGLIVISEPDHYAVLLERARARNKCARLTHPQLDFFTDHWLIVAFPIARLTAVCEPPPE